MLRSSLLELRNWTFGPKMAVSMVIIVFDSLIRIMNFVLHRCPRLKLYQGPRNRLLFPVVVIMTIRGFQTAVKLTIEEFPTVSESFHPPNLQEISRCRLQIHRLSEFESDETSNPW